MPSILLDRYWQHVYNILPYNVFFLFQNHLFIRSPVGGTLYECFKNRNRKLPAAQAARQPAQKRSAPESAPVPDTANESEPCTEEPVEKATRYEDLGELVICFSTCWFEECYDFPFVQLPL